MRIRVLGGGWYGCHIALSLIRAGHDVELHEIADRLFAGASGANPARLHLGFHYPRSRETRAASQANQRRFMESYGHLTRAVPVNIYAVAEGESLVDFGNYCQVLEPEVPFVPIYNPSEFGLANVEGAVLTGERHIRINWARGWFANVLGDHVQLNTPPDRAEGFDVTVDCTFCANSRAGVDRYEPCVTYIYRGSFDRAVTIMDGPFPSFYPHYERGTVSLTSAKFTPLARCKTAEEAQAVIEDMSDDDLRDRRSDLERSMSRFYPTFTNEYEQEGWAIAVRAMPKSGADSRICSVARDGDCIRVRAGKIDAVFVAEQKVGELIDG